MRAGSGAKGEGGHTAMVADILKEKERAEERAKEADAEAKGRGEGQVWWTYLRGSYSVQHPLQCFFLLRFPALYRLVRTAVILNCGIFALRMA